MLRVEGQGVSNDFLNPLSMRLSFSAAEYLAMNIVARLYSLNFQPSTLIVPSASACLTIGCAETSAVRLPGNYNQAARDTLAHRPRERVRASPDPRRILAVVPLIGDQRY